MVLGKWRKRRRAGQRYAYSAWDGSQSGFDLTASDIMAEINDDLLYHGDVNAALRRMMQSGFEANGERIQGLREMLDKLRKERQERLDQHDLGGVYDEIADDLNDVIDTERQSLDQLAEQARQSGDQRRQDITEQVATERNLQLDMMPPDLAGKVKELSNYEFTSSEARQKLALRVTRASTSSSSRRGPSPLAMRRRAASMSFTQALTPGHCPAGICA